MNGKLNWDSQFINKAKEVNMSHFDTNTLRISDNNINHIEDSCWDIFNFWNNNMLIKQQQQRDNKY